jgi:hypothetical protein
VLLKWILYALLVLSIVSVVMLICLFRKWPSFYSMKLVP